MLFTFTDNNKRQRSEARNFNKSKEPTVQKNHRKLYHGKNETHVTVLGLRVVLKTSVMLTRWKQVQETTYINYLKTKDNYTTVITHQIDREHLQRPEQRWSVAMVTELFIVIRYYTSVATTEYVPNVLMSLFIVTFIFRFSKLFYIS